MKFSPDKERNLLKKKRFFPTSEEKGKIEEQITTVLTAILPGLIREEVKKLLNDSSYELAKVLKGKAETCFSTNEDEVIQRNETESVRKLMIERGEMNVAKRKYFLTSRK